MTCDQALHDLAALQAVSLSEKDRELLAEHLVECLACKRHLASVIVEAVPAEGSGPHHVPDADRQNIAAALTRAARW